MMQHSSNRSGQLLGNYRLTRLLGQGGFAEVYLGEHVHLKTQAAVKVLQTHLTQDAVETFRQEAQLIAHLRHPSIVQVYDFGFQDDTAYLIMDYAPHGTLRERHPKGTRLLPGMVVPYVKQMAEALQYAHEQRLIHRDVKPENMLLGLHDELLLSDFGIALTAHSSFSQSTQNVAGTVIYMAPEQIQGHPRPASDQYALGIVVYEWFSGNRPFHGTFTQVALQHSMKQPPSLRQYLPLIPPEVEQVVMTALNKDPQQRFPTIRMFAEALERACSPQRSPNVAAGVSSVPLSPYMTIAQPGSNTPSVSTADIPAPKQPQPLPRRTALLGIGGLIVAAGGGLTWFTLSRQRSVVPPSTPAKATKTAISVPANLIHATAALVTYDGHSDDVVGVDWSPDGKSIATVSDDGTAQVWDADTGNRALSYSSQVDPAESDDSALAVRWSGDGKLFAVGFDDGTAQTIDATSGLQLYSYGDTSNSINSLALSRNGAYLALANDGGQVQVYELTSGKLITRFTGHINSVKTVAWSHDGKHIASGSNDTTVQVWDPMTGHVSLIFKEHTKGVTSVAWSVDDSHIVSCSLDNTAQIWDTHAGRVQLTYSKHKEGWLNAVAWSPNGKYVASAGEVGTVTGNVFIGTSGTKDVNMHVWDAKTGDTYITYQSLPINALSWSPDNSRIATACTNNVAQTWRVL